MSTSLPPHDQDSDRGRPELGPALGRADLNAGSSFDAAGRSLTKVPEITVYFWITKILTTAMGEATSDYLNATLGPAIAVPIMLIGLGLALRLQFRAKGYVAPSYWLVVVMVSVFGTSAADALHVGLGIAYPVSSSFYAVVVAVIFIWWYRSEGTLSIHSIYTRRREKFYWWAVLTTFALGTAVGDLTATSFNLGYLPSGLMFVAIFALPALAYWRLGLNSIVAFWCAYVLTRPLGASFADWLDNPRHSHGLALGTGPVALGLTILIIGFVSYLAVSRKDVQGEQVSPQLHEQPNQQLHEQPHQQLHEQPHQLGLDSSS